MITDQAWPALHRAVQELMVGIGDATARLQRAAPWVMTAYQYRRELHPQDSGELAGIAVRLADDSWRMTLTKIEAIEEANDVASRLVALHTRIGKRQQPPKE